MQTKLQNVHYLLLHWTIAEEFLIKGLEHFTQTDRHSLWPVSYGFQSFLFPSWHTYKSKYKLNSILIILVVQYYILDSFHCFLPHTYLPQLIVDFTLLFPVGGKQV